MVEFLNQNSIKCVIQDKHGKKHEVESQILTTVQVDQAAGIQLEIDEAREKNDPILGSLMRKQCVIFFGNTPDFYKGFSVRVLRNAVSYYNAEMAKENEIENPGEGVQDT